MAQKKSNNAAAKKSSAKEATVVRRVSASPETVKITADEVKKNSAKTEKSDKKPAKKPVKSSNEKSHIPRWIRAIGGYFVGSWRELRQVRWPNRKATWSMTAAVLAFTAFFALLVLLADWIFNWLIKEVIL